MWNLKNKHNKTDSDTANKLVVAREEDGRMGEIGEGN